MREQTEAMRLPRFLWVPFELGRPFGPPDQPAFQRRVLLDALTLLERTDGPVILADFPDDAPAGEDTTVWSCPVSYEPTRADDSDLGQAVRVELGRLAPWAELAPAPAPNSGLRLSQMIDLLARIGQGQESEPEPDRSIIEAIRLAADDLHTWYLHAACQQPGRAGSHERNTWFWRETALAHLIGRVAGRLLDHPDPMVQAFADRGLVPRDHWDLLVPDPPKEAPHG